ncbi:MAG: hypothetical protein ACRC0V_12300, partial [Fusobacteriaceae bacterium]
MIKKMSVSIHDRFQIEIDSIYDFKTNKENLEIDMYLFFPKSLNVNSLTYPKDNFYRNIKKYIRYTGRELSVLDFEAAKAEVDRIGAIREDKKFEREVREFVCSIEESFGHYLLQIKKDTINEQLNTLYASFTEIILYFRENLIFINRVEELNQVDEYIVFFCKQHMLELLYKFNEEIDTEVSNKILEFIERSKIMSKVDDLDDYISQLNVIKKYVHSPLFLHWLRKTDGIIARQVIDSLISFILILASTVVVVTHLNQSGVKYIGVIAIVYVLRDNLKQFIQMLLNKKFLTSVSDFMTKIYASKTNTKVIAIVKEFCEIFTDISVPK